MIQLFEEFNSVNENASTDVITNYYNNKIKEVTKIAKKIEKNVNLSELGLKFDFSDGYFVITDAGKTMAGIDTKKVQAVFDVLVKLPESKFFTWSLINGQAPEKFSAIVLSDSVWVECIRIAKA